MIENIESHVLVALIEAFWQTATQLTELLVPLITIWFVFKLISSLLFVDRA